jgi:hypothetical protein
MKRLTGLKGPDSGDKNWPSPISVQLEIVFSRRAGEQNYRLGRMHEGSTRRDASSASMWSARNRRASSSRFSAASKCASLSPRTNKWDCSAVQSSATGRISFCRCVSRQEFFRRSRTCRRAEDTRRFLPPELVSLPSLECERRMIGANSNRFHWPPDVAREAAVAGGVERLHALLANSESTRNKRVVHQLPDDTCSSDLR